MLSAKKARQRPLIVSGGDRILSNIEKLWIFTIVKMRFGMFEVKYQPQIDQCSLGAHSVPEDGVTPSHSLWVIVNKRRRMTQNLGRILFTTYLSMQNWVYSTIVHQNRTHQILKATNKNNGHQGIKGEKIPIGTYSVWMNCMVRMVVIASLLPRTLSEVSKRNGFKLWTHMTTPWSCVVANKIVNGKVRRFRFSRGWLQWSCMYLRR